MRGQSKGQLAPVNSKRAKGGERDTERERERERERRREGGRKGEGRREREEGTGGESRHPPLSREEALWLSLIRTSFGSMPSNPTSEPAAVLLLPSASTSKEGEGERDGE